MASSTLRVVDCAGFDDEETGCCVAVALDVFLTDWDEWDVFSEWDGWERADMVDGKGGKGSRSPRGIGVGVLRSVIDGCDGNKNETSFRR